MIWNLHTGAVEKGSVELKEYIDLYFNSKYARWDMFQNDKDKECLVLILPIRVRMTIWELGLEVYRLCWWSRNLAELITLNIFRVLVQRMLNNPNRIVTASSSECFTLYMLGFKIPRYLHKRLRICPLLHAFSQIEEKESNLTDKNSEEIYNQYTGLMLEKNPDLANKWKNMVLNLTLIPLWSNDIYNHWKMQKIHLLN